MKNITFITETSEKAFMNPFTGRANSKRVYAVNSEGKKGCLPNETNPYAPIGGRKALLDVLDILVWV